MYVPKSTVLDLKWRSWIVDFLSILYPSSCVSCATRVEGRPLCVACTEMLTFWPEDRSLEGLLERAHRVDLLPPLCVYEKGGLVARLIHDFKYRAQLEVGRYLSELYAYRLVERRIATDYDALLPVPMHWWRLSRRGFNQSTEIARILAGRLGLPLLRHALFRRRYTRRQVKMGQGKRRANVQGNFALRHGVSVRGQRILLVDDVLTTGSTVAACAEVLLESGAASVGVSVLALRV